VRSLPIGYHARTQVNFKFFTSQSTYLLSGLGIFLLGALEGFDLFVNQETGENKSYIK
jgi:hypothetical protein